MITLGIETSCDETAVCLLETRVTTHGFSEYRILANLIHSQADLHAQYGGVFPMMAKREHEKNLPILVEKILEILEILQKNLPISIDRIAVTKGPGLAPALRVGIEYAQKLAKQLGVPIIGVNHMEGHILGSLLTSNEPSDTYTQLLKPTIPALALLISGGHTELILVKNFGVKCKNEYEVIGRTKDDAVGEAYDKVARLLDLPYPGGPHVSNLAEKARGEKTQSEYESHTTLHFPRPMLFAEHSASLDFSFSGLKTAVLYEIRKTNENADMKPQSYKNHLTETQKMEIAREFEDAVTEVLVTKTARAIEKYGARSIIIGGGVIANRHIQNALIKLAKENSIEIYLPPIGVSGDNALMIALVGSIEKEPTPTNGEDIRMESNLSL